MATALITAKTAAETSVDVTVSAGATVAFSVVGKHNGAPIEIRKKDSTGAYWLLTEETLPGETKEATLTNSIRMRSVSNNTSTAMTVQVFKPASGVASGVDQD
jgi:hypothetical protein